MADAEPAHIVLHRYLERAKRPIPQRFDADTDNLGRAPGPERGRVVLRSLNTKPSRVAFFVGAREVVTSGGAIYAKPDRPAAQERAKNRAQRRREAAAARRAKENGNGP